MVHSGVSVYARYRTEGLGNFGTDTSAGSWYSFGRNTKISGLRWNPNQNPLPQLDSIQVEKFYWGRNEGTMSVDWTLSNSQILETLIDPKSSNSYDTNPYSTGNSDARRARSFQVEVGHRNDNIKTTYKGCILQTLNIKTAVNDPVNCTASVMFGRQEVATSGLATDSVISTMKSNSANNIEPFTFVNSSISATPSNKLFAGTTNNVIQDIDLNINANQDLLYGLNSANAADAYRKVFEITGRMTIALEDAYALQTCAGRSEFANMTVSFSKNSKTMTLLLGGVALGEHVRPSISPEEVIMQELSFQARSATISGFT